MGQWQITITGRTAEDEAPPALATLETMAEEWARSVPAFARADVTRAHGTASQASSFGAADLAPAVPE